jgi:DNA-binding IclR family transcriptional regulator
MAAPIRDNNDEIIASIGISAPVKRFPREHAPEFARKVLDISSRIAAVLTAEPPR